MANSVKSYHFPPTWDFRPGGPLSLGTVLSSVKNPLPPVLIRDIASSIPQATTDDPSRVAGAEPEHPQIFKTAKYDVSYSTSQSVSGSASLFASFAAQILGIGPDVSTQVSRGSELKLHFARVETQEWYPSIGELQRLVEHSSVARCLKRLQAWNTKAVFVVTGVKLAYGARAETKRLSTTKGEAKVSLDPGLMGAIPGVVEFGPGVKLEKETKLEAGWSTGVEGTEDPGFLFAYKVQRVKVKVKKNGEVFDLSNQEYTRGALYDGNEPIIDEPEAYEVDVDWSENDAVEQGIPLEGTEGKEDDFLVIPW